MNIKRQLTRRFSACNGFLDTSRSNRYAGQLCYKLHYVNWTTKWRTYNSALRRRIKQMLINKFSWRLIRRAREPAEIESNSENSIFWFTGQRLSVSQIEQLRTGCYEHMNIFKTSSLLKKDVEKDRFENKFNAATREIPGSSVDQIGNWPLSNQAKLKLIFELAFVEPLSLSLTPSALGEAIESQLRKSIRESINN